MNLNTKFKVGQVVYYYDWDLEEVRQAEIVDVERVATEKGQTTLYLCKHPYSEGCLQSCESDLVSANKQEIHPEEFHRLADSDNDTYTDEVEFDDSSLGKIFCITTSVGKVNLKFMSITMTTKKILAQFSSTDPDAALGLGARISASRDACNVFEMTTFDLEEKLHDLRSAVILAIDEPADEGILSSAEYNMKLNGGLGTMDLFTVGNFQ